MTAAFTGSTEIVRLLVEHGADPNVISRNNHRHRPLHRVLEHKKTIPRAPNTWTPCAPSSNSARASTCGAATAA